MEVAKASSLAIWLPWPQVMLRTSTASKPATRTCAKKVSADAGHMDGRDAITWEVRGEFGAVAVPRARPSA